MAEHGSLSRYQQGCRCDVCRSGHSAYQRGRQVRKRGGTEEEIAEAMATPRGMGWRRKRPVGGHGSRLEYRAGCRCEECRAANTKYQLEANARRAARQSATFEHGASAYKNWGCRCEVCTVAHSAACADYHARVKAQGGPRNPRPRSPIPHGSRAGYRRGCRCDDCREANRAAERARYWAAKARAS